MGYGRIIRNGDGIRVTRPKLALLPSLQGLQFFVSSGYFEPPARPWLRYHSAIKYIQVIYRYININQL